MSFADELVRFHRQAVFDTREVFVNSASAALSSIQNGDPRTGAPGQQVDTGNLKGSWQLRFKSDAVAEITTNAEYAKQEEEGIAASGTPITQRSEVGGPHSLALTVANFDRIVESEAQKVNAR